MATSTKSIIYISKKCDLLTNIYIISHQQPFAKQLLRESMRIGKNIQLDELTPELEQIIRYNNGYLEHKYKIQYL